MDYNSVIYPDGWGFVSAFCLVIVIIVLVAFVALLEFAAVMVGTTRSFSSQRFLGILCAVVVVCLRDTS